MLVEVNVFVCWKCIENMRFCIEVLNVGIVTICSIIIIFGTGLNPIFLCMDYYAGSRINFSTTFQDSHFSTSFLERDFKFCFT